MDATPLHHHARERSGSASTGLVRHHVGGSGDDVTAEDMMEEGWTGRRPRLSMMITSGSAVERRRLQKRSSSSWPSRRSVLAAVLLLVLLVVISVCSVAAATSMGVDSDIKTAFVLIALVNLVFVVLGCCIVKFGDVVLLLILLAAISVCSVAAATSMGVDHDIKTAFVLIALVNLVFVVLGFCIVKFGDMV
ncbi:hypothetical protein EJB05_15106 [Eragrostis curvula]|uniref:Uncharacterized protein n=1 Tax=Eragrostis curvula TaxID=38414 RepID=A0A5J9W104_9POAL|nr:hypothetical protein EJB05_15106 [Eragrostis curvula]